MSASAQRAGRGTAKVRRRAPLIATLALALTLAAGDGRAVVPAERLEDPALEARARALSKELRCVVCQNQSIDESDADLAKDLRLLVRERLTEGDTDAEVLTYLTERYGAFVRLKPPLTASTVVLWGLPFVIIVVALAAGALYLRRRTGTPQPVAGLTDEEEAALNTLLGERADRSGDASDPARG